ncbi:MAG TPA: hypothetical protein GXZ51_02475 [Acholeplasma sp.]|nr:hypothetical protein [Acholeplasma sp.]
MIRCIRCGMENDDKNEVCGNCGYSFKEQKVEEEYRKLLREDPSVPEEERSGLVDSPILTFVFGLLSMLLPILVFSFLAWYNYKKPSKVKLEPLRNLGNIFAYIGAALSIFLLVYIVWGLIASK